jgi:hypothetical protein
MRVLLQEIDCLKQRLNRPQVFSTRSMGKYAKTLHRGDDLSFQFTRGKKNEQNTPSNLEIISIKHNFHKKGRCPAYFVANQFR